VDLYQFTVEVERRKNGARLYSHQSVICADTSIKDLDWTFLRRRHTRAIFLNLLHHAVEIRITGAKSPRKPVPAALSNPLAVRKHLELAGLPGSSNRFNAGAL
jgi:hypothetical protein